MRLAGEGRLCRVFEREKKLRRKPAKGPTTPSKGNMRIRSMIAAALLCAVAQACVGAIGVIGRSHRDQAGRRTHHRRRRSVRRRVAQRDADRQSGTRPTPATTPSRRSRTSAISPTTIASSTPAFEFDDPNPSRDARAVSPIATTSATASTTTAASFIDARQQRPDRARCSSSRRATSSTTRSLDDASGEDSSPDFFWDSATKITEHGWTLEMRIPFSSLRYQNGDPQTWGILLYRNYPRDRHYQFFSAKLPRGGNCFICRVEHARPASSGCRPAAISSPRRT